MTDLPQWLGGFLQVLNGAGRVTLSTVCDNGSTRLDLAPLPAGWYCDGFVCQWKADGHWSICKEVTAVERLCRNVFMAGNLASFISTRHAISGICFSGYIY